MVGTLSSARRQLAHLGLAALIAAACDSGTAPEATLTGVWGARTGFDFGTDTLTLALAQEGSAVRGYALTRQTADVTDIWGLYLIQGSITGRSVELYFAAATGFPLPPFALRGMLARNGESVDLLLESTGYEVTLARANPPSSEFAHTWILSSSTLDPPENAPVVRDTIVAYPDGRAWRSRNEEGYAYASLATWTRRGDWFVLEQVAGFALNVPIFDSLRVESEALVRTTQLGGGSTLRELYLPEPIGSGVRR
jgi:hypothetical protein